MLNSVLTLPYTSLGGILSHSQLFCPLLGVEVLGTYPGAEPGLSPGLCSPP